MAAKVSVGLEPVSVTVATASAMIGLGRTKVFELIARGELRSFTEGRRRLVSVASIREWEARRLASDRVA